jgi:hypothetical protein
MKVGDLVRCIWQPGVSKYVRGKGCISMKYTIKGELGIIVRQHAHCHVILFPQFGYEHDLSAIAIEVISECR